MTNRIAAVLACAACVGLLAACGSDEAGGPHRNFHQGRDPTTGDPGGLSLLNFGGGKSADTQGAAIPVNAYLWRGALETLKFMPLTQADPFGGDIITDWWTPPGGGGERFKVTAYVLSRDLRADGVRVSLFRQVLENGQWVDAAVDPAKPTDLENMILARARDLRAQAAAK